MKIQIQILTRFEGVHVHGNGLRQGMPNIRGWNAMRRQQIYFERKNTQHMVDALFDFFNAVCPPCPNGGTDKLHSRNASLFQITL